MYQIRLLTPDGTNHEQMLRAVISARFSSGPGHTKVLAGEYEIFNTSDTTQLLSELDFQSLVPGMRITMAFIIGRYLHGTFEECPRPGCRARKFVRKSAGGRICSDCGVWFDFSREILLRPFQLDLTEGSFYRLRTERKWFKNVKICSPIYYRTLTIEDPGTSPQRSQRVQRSGQIKKLLATTQFLLEVATRDMAT